MKYTLYKETLAGDGEIDGSAVKGPSYSFSQLRFDSQNANGGSQPFVMLVPQAVPNSFGCCGYQHAYGE